MGRYKFCLKQKNKKKKKSFPICNFLGLGKKFIYARPVCKDNSNIAFICDSNKHSLYNYSQSWLFVLNNFYQNIHKLNEKAIYA